MNKALRDLIDAAKAHADVLARAAMADADDAGMEATLAISERWKNLADQAERSAMEP